MTPSLKTRLKTSINRSKKQIFLRSDFDHFGDYRQVTRALSLLTEEDVLTRAGYGLYKKNTGLTEPLDQVLESIKSRLGRRVSRTVQIGDTTVLLGQKKTNKPNAQVVLDQFKLRLAEEVVKRIDLNSVREKSLSNLSRWKEKGTWCSAYSEWEKLLRSGSDKKVISVMTGHNENSNRLRQSSPYTGLLDRQTVEHLRETTRP